jgi:predicted PurR-regulated permease PerM
MADEPSWNTPLPQVARRTALILAVILAFAAATAILWLASTAVLAILVGILFAVLLDAGARGLGQLVDCDRRYRLAVVFFLTAFAIGAAIWWGGTTIIQQANQFAGAMQDLLQQLGKLLAENGLRTSGQGSIDVSSLLPSPGVIFGGATKVASSMFEAVTIVAAILFLGAFFAWEPAVYKAAFLSILPADRRQRVDQVLDQAAHAMRDWMLGQSVSMVAIFLFSLGALLLIKMPYPILLAVQAGLLTFIPTVGPFIAGVIIILAGLSQSFTMALYGVGTYAAIQFLESHLITPMVQERTVRLPPGFTLGIQLISGLLFGFLGVAFSVPLAAAGKVLIEELYVKDRLGGPWPLN